MSRKLIKMSFKFLTIGFMTLFFKLDFADERAMTESAISLLNSLSEENRALMLFALPSDEQSRWHFVPEEIFPREGISLKEMTDEQRGYAKSLLQGGLSQRGYLTVDAIMELEKVLHQLESNSRFARDSENYRVTIFGEPRVQGTWAWRFEGHHISLHFQLVDGILTVSSPTFFGSNPAHVTEGAQMESQIGQRVLGDREDAGRALVSSLNEMQLGHALIDVEAPRDILTGADFPIDSLEPAGLAAGQLNEAQLILLKNLITVYTSSMTEVIADKRWQKIEQDGLESISFSWAGGLDLGEPHYYRVQGLSFLIEYDNVQNGANHVHSVWRDFEGDFGEDLLRQHYQEHTH